MPLVTPSTLIGAPQFSPDRLRRVRHTAGLTLTDVATRIGRTDATISRYETGRTQPSVMILGPLAYALGVRVDALFETPASE